MTTQQKVIVFLEEKLKGEESPAHIETALSHIFAGNDVYKLKKAKDAGYVDMTPLSARLECCQKEVQLNKRYAPEIYLGVKAVVPDGDSFVLLDGQHPEACEYVVHMRRFASGALLAEQLQEASVTPADMYGLARRIAEFHKANPSARDCNIYDSLQSGTSGVFKVLDETLNETERSASYLETKHTFLDKLKSLKDTIEERSQIVQGHGDLHTGNICLWQGDFIPFDGIDFSEGLSCIDQMSDVAFVVMDLMRHRRKDLAYALLNQYLEETGDYSGLELLPLFCAYRALVRMMVSVREEKWEDCDKYHAVANAFLADKNAYLVAVGGLSGTGKSTVNRELVQMFGGIQLRSDVIRKQLLKVELGVKAGADAYSTSVTEQTYAKLEELAGHILGWDFPVFVDATFRSEKRRNSIRNIAQGKVAEFTGIWCEVPPEVALQRVLGRRGDASDADVSVFESQRQQNVGTIDWNRLDCSGTVEEVAKAALEIVLKSEGK